MILSDRQKVHINAFKDRLLKLLKHLKNYHQPNLKSDDLLSSPSLFAHSLFWNILLKNKSEKNVERMRKLKHSTLNT